MDFSQNLVSREKVTQNEQILDTNLRMASFGHILGIVKVTSM